MSAVQQGVLYGVGVGPGDPELLTRKAERVIREATVVCLPTASEGADSYARSIVGHLLDAERQRIVELVFPMTMDKTVLESSWRTAVDEVAARLSEGESVAFVTEGDPTLYSTFIYLRRLLLERAPEAKIEIVPGVTSFTASAALAGLPLVDGTDRMVVLGASHHLDTLEATLRDFDCVVMLKVSRVFDRVLDHLETLGLADRAVYVRRVGSPQQEVVRDVRSLRGRKLDYLSLLIVRK